MTEIVAADLKRIYLTLKILGEDLDIETVSQKLQLEPTSTILKNQFLHATKTRSDKNVWSLSTKDLESLNIKEHFAKLFKLLEGKQEVLTALRQNGYFTVVSCYWLCSGGDNTEPYLSFKNIKQLAEFGMDFWFDVYTGCPSE